MAVNKTAQQAANEAVENIVALIITLSDGNEEERAAAQTKLTDIMVHSGRGSKPQSSMVFFGHCLKVAQERMNKAVLDNFHASVSNMPLPVY